MEEGNAPEKQPPILSENYKNLIEKFEKYAANSIEKNVNTEDWKRVLSYDSTSKVIDIVLQELMEIRSTRRLVNIMDNQGSPGFGYIYANSISSEERKINYYVFEYNSSDPIYTETSTLIKGNKDVLLANFRVVNNKTEGFIGTTPYHGIIIQPRFNLLEKEDQDELNYKITNGINEGDTVTVIATAGSTEIFESNLNLTKEIYDINAKYFHGGESVAFHILVVKPKRLAKELQNVKYESGDEDQTKTPEKDRKPLPKSLTPYVRYPNDFPNSFTEPITAKIRKRSSSLSEQKILNFEEHKKEGSPTKGKGPRNPDEVKSEGKARKYYFEYLSDYAEDIKLALKDMEKRIYPDPKFEIPKDIETKLKESIGDEIGSMHTTRIYTNNKIKSQIVFAPLVAIMNIPTFFNLLKNSNDEFCKVIYEIKEKGLKITIPSVINKDPKDYELVTLIKLYSKKFLKKVEKRIESQLASFKFKEVDVESVTFVLLESLCKSEKFEAKCTTYIKNAGEVKNQELLKYGRKVEGTSIIKVNLFYLSDTTKSGLDEIFHDNELKERIVTLGNIICFALSKEKMDQFNKESVKENRGPILEFGYNNEHYELISVVRHNTTSKKYRYYVQVKRLEYYWTANLDPKVDDVKSVFTWFTVGSGSEQGSIPINEYDFEKNTDFQRILVYRKFDKKTREELQKTLSVPRIVIDIEE